MRIKHVKTREKYKDFGRRRRAQKFFLGAKQKFFQKFLSFQNIGEAHFYDDQNLGLRVGEAHP